MLSSYSQNGMDTKLKEEMNYMFIILGTCWHTYKQDTHDRMMYMYVFSNSFQFMGDKHSYIFMNFN